MSDVNANIGVHIDTSSALTQLKNLQRQISTFHSQISKSSATAAMAQKNLQNNLLNAINATGKFHAQMGVVKTSTESFTNALEKNKLSMGQYFRFAGGASKSFGKLFKQEFDTIGKVAEERVKKMQTQYIKMGRDASGAMKAMSITPNTLNMKDYGTQVAISAQRQALFNQLVKQGSTNLLNFGKNTQWAGRQLMVGFSVPLLYVGTAAGKVFMDLEQQALKFKRVYGDMFTTTDETNKALKDIELLAKEFTKYGVAVSKTMEMAASAAAMGQTGAELTAQVAQATRLAVLGNVEQEQALETTISLTSAFGLAAQDLASKIDFLNSVENQTIVSIEDLTIAVPKAGPVVKQLGGDVEDLAFFLTAMKEGGINASEGANALKSGLAALINPTGKASAMLNDLGVNINKIVESNQGDIKNTVIEFAQALDTLAPLDRSRAIEQLFGKFQFARLSTLFQNITKEGTQANRVLELSKMEVEELAILSERELKTIENAVGTNFKEAVETLKLTIAPIGKTFLEAVTPIVKAVAGILEKFNDLSDGTKKFIVIASTLVGIIGPALLMAFGLIANGAANIIKLFLGLRSGFLKLGGNTKILAEQTGYLNSEQLEAATVAASLNQAHTTLTQSFVLETSAVKALRNAYVDATVASANFARANPGMMMPGAAGKAPKKFARGTTSVPGTGNKDTVPSVLTPGEAVIPAPVAQDPRFQPIIDAMVNGKLQGFNGGTTGAMPEGKQSAKQVNSEVAFSHITGDTSGRGEKRTIQQLYDSNEFKGSDQKVLKSYVDAGMGKLSASAYSSLGFDIPKELNSQLATSSGASKEAYIRAISKPGAINTMVQMLMKDGMSSGEAIRSAHAFRKAYKQEISTLGPVIKDGDLVSKTKNLLASGKFGNILPLSSLNVAQRPSAGDIGKFISDKSTTSTGYNYDVAKRILKRENISLGKELGSNFRKTNQEIQIFRDESGKIIGIEARDPSTNKVTHRGANLPGRGLDMVRVKGGGRFGGYASLSSRIKSTSELGSALTKAQSKKMKSFYEKLVVAKGEILQTQGGKKRTVTGQTGTAKPSGTNITDSPRDTRVIDKKSVRRVFPYGMKGPRVAGAINGYDENGKLGFNRGLGSDKTPKIVQENIDATEKQTKEIKSSSVATKDNAKQTKLSKENIRAFGAKANVGVGALSGLTIAASFAGGKVGEMAQKIMPFIFGLQGVLMLLPLLMNPLVGIPLALGAVVAGILLYNKKQQDAIKAQARLVDELYATTKKMQQVGEITGKVGASQLAARKRESATGDFSVERKGIKFGSSFLQSEVGKADIAAFETRFKAMPDIAMKEFSLKLASYVSDGVIDAAQAASIADQVGLEFKNKVIGMKLQGELQKLLTVDGKDLTKEPFEIRIQIAQETIDQFTNITPNLQAQLGLAEKELLKLEKIALLPVVTEGLSREEAEKANRAWDEANVNYDKAKEKIDKINAALKQYNAFSAAMASQSFESIQAQIDAIDVGTSKTIDKLKADKAATKDLAAQALIQKEIDRLETKKLESVIKLRNMNKQVTKGIEEQLKLAKDQGKIGEFFVASSEAITNRFKGTKQETDAKAFLDRSKAMGETTMRAKIEAVVSSGQFGPSQATQFLNLFGTDTENLNKTFNTYLTAQGLEDLDKLQSVLGDFADTELAKEIMIKMGGLSDSEFQAQYSTLELLKQFDGEEINMEIALKQDPNLLTNVTKLNSAIEAIAMTPDTTSKTVEIALKNVVLEGSDPSFSEEGISGLSKNWEYYKNLAPDVRKTAIQTYVSLFSTIFTSKDARIQWAANLAETASAGIGNQQARDQIRTLTYNTVIKSDGSFTEQGKKTLVEDVQKQTEDIIGYMDMINKLTSRKGSVGGGTDSRNTFLDNILDKIRRVRDASADIVSKNPLGELRRLIEKGNGEITIFDGLDQQISKLKAPQEFIDFIASLDPKGKKGGIESLATYLDTEQLSKGIVKLTKDGKLLLDIFREGVIGDFESDLRKATNGLIAQKTQFIELNLVVKDNKKSAEMLADANFALALSSAKTTTEVKRLVDAWEAADKAKRDYAATTDPLGDLQNQFDDVANKIDRYFSLAQTEIESRYARRIFLAEQQVEAAQDAVEKAQKNVSNIQDAIDDIQSKIDEKQVEIETAVTRPLRQFEEAISAIEKEIKASFDEPIAILQEESSDLANDLTLLDRAAEEINKKYDLQAEALDKISQINQELISQDKQRISLADALSSGDISAAAQAIQDIRQGSANAASRSTKELLDSAKQAELDKQRNAAGLTRLQIEQRQFAISQAIFKFEEGRELREADIARIKRDNILPLETKREGLLKEIRGHEDRIYEITNGIGVPKELNLKLANNELDTATRRLTKETELLSIIQADRKKELDHLAFLQLEWIEIQGGIAGAELKTINLQKAIQEAIRLAKLLAAEFSRISVPGGGVPGSGVATSVSVDQEAADAAAAAADAAAASEAIDAATAAADAAADAVASLAADADAISASVRSISRTAIVKATNTKSLNQAVALAEGVLSPEAIAVNMGRALTNSKSMTQSLGGTAGALSAARYTGQAMRYATMSSGGMVMPKYFAAGGLSRGTDTVPAMLTPGEFVMSKYAVSNYGVDKMKAINSGTYEGEKVYNYNLSVNVKSDSNPDDIARVVIKQIQQLDNQRVRKQAN